MREFFSKPCFRVVARKAASTSWQKLPDFAAARASAMPALVASCKATSLGGGLPTWIERESPETYRLRKPPSSILTGIASVYSSSVQLRWGDEVRTPAGIAGV